MTYQQCTVPVEMLKRHIDCSFGDEASLSAQTRFWNKVQGEAQRSAAGTALPVMWQALQ